MSFIIKGAEIAQRYSKDCAELEGFDFSEESIRSIDKCLQRLSKDQTLDSRLLSRQYGSYVGEVYRRHHGGEWGTMEGVLILGIQNGTQTFWPWAKCLQALCDQDEDIEWYYHHMVTSS